MTKRKVFAALKVEKVLNVNKYLEDKNEDLREFRNKWNEADNSTATAEKFFREREQKVAQQFRMVKDMLESMAMVQKIDNYEVTLVAEEKK